MRAPRSGKAVQLQLPPDTVCPGLPLLVLHFCSLSSSGAWGADPRSGQRDSASSTSRVFRLPCLGSSKGDDGPVGETDVGVYVSLTLGPGGRGFWSNQALNLGLLTNIRLGLFSPFHRFLYPFLLSFLWTKQGFSRLSALGAFTQLFHAL